VKENLVLIVCGGRDYEDSRTIWRTLDEVRWKRGIAKIKHGGCRTGADAIAHGWAEKYGIPVEVFDADWEAHGKAAGPMRNQKMADSGADGCIAFPGGRGTADMIRRAEAAGIPVWQPETSPSS
jgi:hypothetical protein